MTTVLDKDFAIGDRVWLNSGSPPMTIKSIDNGWALVEWQGPNGKQTADFDLRTLSKAEVKV